MRRVLSVYLPRWPIDLLIRRRERCGRARPGLAHVLIHQRHQCEFVAACCSAALARGVRPGMKLAHARSLVPPSNLVVAPSRPERDLAALDALARWAVRFTPSVAADPPEGLWLDVTGCERLYGGERALAARVLAGLERLRLHARVAIAATTGCAWAVARFGRRECSVVPAGREEEALGPLPVAGLRIEEETDAALQMLNVCTIGELLRLPRGDTAARLGPGVVRRIDQALGRLAEGICPLRHATPVHEEVCFAGPTTQPEAVELAVRGLVSRLAARLRELESGAGELLLTLARVDAPPVRAGLRLASPTRDGEHLWRLLRPRVERMSLGYGVEAVSLTALRQHRLEHEQVESAALGGPPTHTTEGVHRDQARVEGVLIDTLVNRLGPEGVRELGVRESLLPERVFELRSHGAGRVGKNGGVTPHDRPTVLLPSPEPAAVMCLTPDGPVVSVEWRGRAAAVRTSLGPERISPEWWESRGTVAARDYFRVEDELGRWLWLLRVGSSWYVHGEWL